MEFFLLLCQCHGSARVPAAVGWPRGWPFAARGARLTRPRVHLRLTERNRIARILCMSRSRAALLLRLHGCTVVPRSSNGTASLAKICVERAVRYGTGSLPNHSCNAGCSPLAIASLRSSRGLKLHNGVTPATLTVQLMECKSLFTDTRSVVQKYCTTRLPSMCACALTVSAGCSPCIFFGPCKRHANAQRLNFFF